MSINIVQHKTVKRNLLIKIISKYKINKSFRKIILTNFTIKI